MKKSTIFTLIAGVLVLVEFIVVIIMPDFYYLNGLTWNPWFILLIIGIAVFLMLGLYAHYVEEKKV